MRKWACGTVTGLGTSTNSTKNEHFVTNTAEDSPIVRNEHSLSKVLNSSNFQCGVKGMGRACQRLIDYGRCEFMKDMLFSGQEINVGISHYVEDNITPQNALLFASIK